VPTRPLGRTRRATTDLSSFTALAVDTFRGMSTRAEFDFDGLMRHLMVVGFVALTVWTAASTTGMALGLLQISPSATLRFLLAVLVLVFARRTYWEVQEWRWRRLPPDERFGFANPIWEHARASEHAQPATLDGREGEPDPRQ
jgi:hypothetical protein